MLRVVFGNGHGCYKRGYDSVKLAETDLLRAGVAKVVRFSAHFGLWLLGLRIWRTDLKTVRSQFQDKDFFFRHVSISFKVELIVQHGPAQAIGKQFVFGHRSDTRAKTERTKKNSLETFDL